MKCWSCGGPDAKPMAFVEKPTVAVFDLCATCKRKDAFSDSMTEIKG